MNDQANPQMPDSGSMTMSWGLRPNLSTSALMIATPTGMPRLMTTDIATEYVTSKPRVTKIVGVHDTIV